MRRRERREAERRKKCHARNILKNAVEITRDPRTRMVAVFFQLGTVLQKKEKQKDADRQRTVDQVINHRLPTCPAPAFVSLALMAYEAEDKLDRGVLLNLLVTS